MSESHIQRFDIREQYRALRAEILESIDQVFQSGCLILGPRLRALELAVADYLAVPGFAVGVGSGTDALYVALRALGIGPGDEVITVANTAVATASAIRMTGAQIAFCDVDPETLTMDPRDARRRISPRTRAIVPVHLFGNAVDMRAIADLAREHNLRIVEDCAQSFGTRVHGRPAGTWSDVACFSFYPTKNLGAYGDAGMCFTPDANLAQAIRQIRTYGSADASPPARDGINSRLDEVQAAILHVKLKYLPRDLDYRARIAQMYIKGLTEKCVRVQTTPETLHSHCLFVVRVPSREPLLARLRDAGIECGVHYPVPIHLMEGYRTPGFGPGSLPHSENSAREVLSLPCYPGLSREDVSRVIGVLNEALDSQ